jgi:purine-cytosine permease-like protein
MPRQKWRGISIFGMTNPFEPPKKFALGDAELAQALEAAQSQEGSLGAMELLEEQSKLRAADSHAYVLWVREMEKLATTEAKDALSAARLAASGLTPSAPAEEPVSAVTEDSWKSLVPDWDDRQQATELAKEKAIADALSLAEQKAQEELENAVAAAVAEAEFEAELKREEAVAKFVAEAEAAAAEKLAEQVRIAEEQSELAAAAAEQERLEAERIEAERVEVERAALEQAEAERVALEQAEEARAEELMREELEKAELAAIEAQIAAEEEAKAVAESLAKEEPLPAVEDTDPQPVRAVDFATGSFDIVDSAEQAASEDFDEDSFEVLLSDGELGFAKEPADSLKDSPISTIDRRAKPYSQLFVWSSLSAGLLPLLFGYLTLPLQLTFADKLLSLFAGLSVSALLISVAAIAGKRSGLPTLFLSRAAFGVRANAVPAATLILVKLAFGVAVVLGAISLFDKTVVALPSMASSAFAIGDIAVSWLMMATAVVLAVASLIAFFGGKTLYFAQLAVAAGATLVSIAFMVLTAPQIGLESEDLVFSNNWISVTGLAILVSIIFGGFWTTSVAEFTRKVSMAQSGKKLALFIALSVGVIPLLLASFSLLVAGSLPKQFVEAAALNPLGALLALVPAWMASALLVSGVLSLLIWVTAWLYSTSVGLSAVSIRIRPALSQPLLVVLTFAIAFTATTFSTAAFAEIFDSVIAVSGVVVFAWAGVFIADVTLRKIAYHEVSLTRDYGFYKAANFVNLAAFVTAVAIGLGFVSSTVVGLDWLGYFADLTATQDWSDANIGAAIALGFSVLFPILFGRKRIRAQESEVLAIEARKSDLEHVDLDEQ